jgi:NADH-quinone oxidoreductase subunit M
MNVSDLPWVEIAVLAPLLGAAGVRFARTTEAAGRIAAAVTAVALGAAVLAWVVLLSGGAPPRFSLSDELFGRQLLRVDRLSGPLLPMVALLHLLTIVTTARVKMNRMSFTGHLVGETIRLATFACLEPWPLVALLAVGTVPPYLELRDRRKPTRVYVLHMALFVGLLVGGAAGLSSGGEWAPALLMAAVLVRSGTVPAHLWVADLFRHATFGTALLFATPIAGVYAALRLVLPVAPEWVLQSIGIASQATALYAAAMAVVQTDARRFFSYLFLSHASLVLIGLELHTATSLSGSLGLWVSAALSLGGLGLVLRALEARHGPLSLAAYRGLYDQTPALAVGFILMGLGCVGFPGTLGFVAVEVLVDGAMEVNLSVGIAMVVVAALNGIAVVRAYLLLFTGCRHRSAVPLPVTARERGAVLLLSALILGGGLAPQYLLADRRLAADEVYPATIRHQTALPHVEL